MGLGKYKRKQPNLVVRDQIYIVCGGDTEQIYFKNFCKKYHDKFSGRKVKIIKYPHDPLKIVNYCVQLKAQKKDLLKVWAVFDKDDFQNFEQAIQTARENKVRCAFSNQAFEVWVIHHFCDLKAPLHRNQYAEKIKKLTQKDYVKSGKNLNQLFEKMLEYPRIEEAVKNAQKSFLYHEGTEHAGQYSDYESCTTVYQLVKDLIDA